MKNFIFKSQTPSTYKKLFQSIETIQKNVLYLTYQVDKLVKIARVNETDKGLQQQVDQYFEDDSKDIPDSKEDLD